MMIGSVTRLHALVPVTFRIPGQPDLAIEFVVDTGYTGSLTLPLEAIRALGLEFEFDLPANLADDSEVLVPVYSATILWHGIERSVQVLAMGKRPLLGTLLLDGHKLCAQFREQGRVAIALLS
ncbi:MAG TPA: clan AA aspartic protease [Chthonomonadaceae bacterium]|nr:clan AA aspartic protease [Chthonomonadaceae bacterium]